MQPSSVKTVLPASEVLSGRYSKREAAKHIAEGIRHLHSNHTFGDSDPAVKLTREAVVSNKTPLYVWEKFTAPETVWIEASEDRGTKINAILERMDLKKSVKEKTETILEELLSNSIFHSYQNSDRSPKYGRRQNVLLSHSEKIKVCFSQSEEGVFLSVTDQGGNLGFESIAKAFSRCYGNVAQQIEKKEAGAGLGIYMIFEQVTHLKIQTMPKQHTCCSVWLAERNSYDPEIFSFNFFSEESRGY